MEAPTIILLLFALLVACNPVEKDEVSSSNEGPETEIELVVLGITQDAGAPQAGCLKTCCTDRHLDEELKHRVVSLGIIDKIADQSFLLEATPDFVSQIHDLSKYTSSQSHIPTGIFLTHAHMGHYSGLVHLGKEAMNTDKVPVYAMPRMREFLRQNGPWSQLCTNQNIELKPLHDSISISLSERLKIIPFTVPHRDEFSETVGYKIHGPNKSALFIPDIDKWSKWRHDIKTILQEVDYAFLDATFYDGAEINHRDISEIPHPFIIESLEEFKSLESSEKSKIHFIHFNHTNPALERNSAASKKIKEMGFNLASDLQVFEL